MFIFKHTFLFVCSGLVLFIGLFSTGCQSTSLDSRLKEDESSTLTKAGLSEEERVDYGQYPTDFVRLPYITLENGIRVNICEDSLYVFDGDILLSEKDLEMLSKQDTADMNLSRSASIITSSSSSYRWPNGVVPYYMTISMPPAYRATAFQAMSTISACSAVTFVPAYPLQDFDDYIAFQYSSSGNNSYVGRQGGGQPINIHTNHKGIFMHEIMHALGFFHEHSRSDRNSYISIEWSNIRDEMEYSFYQYTSGVDIGEFDFESIMLYSSYISDPTFVYNPSIPVIRKLDNNTFDAQRDSLSAGDINGLLNIYGIP